MSKLRNHPFFAPGILLFSAFLFVSGIWVVREYFISPYSIPAQELFGGEVPERFKPLGIFRAPNGITASFFDRKLNQKAAFSVSFDKPTQQTEISGSEILRGLVESKSGSSLDPRLSGFSAVFAGAEFDPRRAQPGEEETVDTPAGQVKAVNFFTVQEWQHAIFSFNLPQGQVMVVAARNGSKVDLVGVSELLRSISTLRPIK